MKLKSPTRGVILDLIKSHVYWLPGLLIIAIPFIGVVRFFFRLVACANSPQRSWMAVGCSVNYFCQSDNNSRLSALSWWNCTVHSSDFHEVTTLLPPLSLLMWHVKVEPHRTTVSGGALLFVNVVEWTNGVRVCNHCFIYVSLHIKCYCHGPGSVDPVF